MNTNWINRWFPVVVVSRTYHDLSTVSEYNFEISKLNERRAWVLKTKLILGEAFGQKNSVFFIDFGAWIQSCFYLRIDRYFFFYHI